MKQSIRKIVGKLRRQVADVVPGQVKPKRRRQVAAPLVVHGMGHTRTGQTVFDDRPLRFRSLTLAEPDYPSFAQSSALEGAFKIRVAKRTHAHRDALTLVQKKYAGRGYAVPIGKRRPRVLTFVAYDEGQIVGTVGVGAESDHGLSADELYHEEIDRLRAAGCRVCEFTRLAVDRTAASKPVLAGLFHTAYLYASKICGYTHAVIEVNPRHVAFYGRQLKFDPIGPERLNTRVNAPAVLLCASFETIAEGLARCAGRSPPAGTRRALFHYGFPPEEEQGVLRRLCELVA
ncbi:MAG TPA: long-chain N-acyl amino acid synthase [Casimicrobiaceae bacterium]